MMKTIRMIILSGIAWLPFLAGGQPTGNAFIFKYDLTGLLGDQVTNSMGVKVGAEYFTKNNASMIFDAMYVFPCAACKTSYTRITTEKTHGFSMSAGYRFYLVHGKKRLTGFHLGPLVSFLYTRSEMKETYGGGLQSHYQVYRNLLTAHAMAGYQLRITGPLFFDPAIGLGLRYVSSRNKNKQGTGTGQHEFPYDKDFESGESWFPGININIRIGIKL